MNVSIKCCLSLCIYLIAVIDTGYGVEILYNEDEPYEVIDIAVPNTIWKQAVNPTPVLKSQATVVIPINVSDEDDSDEYSEDDEIEDVVTTPTTVASTTAAQEITSVVNDPVKNVTDIPVQDEELATETPTEVSGQVIRFPCSCTDGKCGCCTGAILERINMKACGNISFIPEDFVFDVRLSVNNQTVVRRKVSASDPPPICFNPIRAPFVRVCAEISNIRIRNRNAFACLDINADIGGFPVYSASFRCFGLGTSGVQTGLKPKPVSSGGPKPVNLFGSSSNNEPGFIENAIDTVLTGGIGEAVLGGGAGSGIFGGGGGSGIFGGSGGSGIFGGGGGSGIFGGGGGSGIFGGGGGPGIFGGGGAGGIFRRKKV